MSDLRLKRTKFALVSAESQTPLGELTAVPILPAVFKGLTSNGREGLEEHGKGGRRKGKGERRSGGEVEGEAYATQNLAWRP